MPIVYDPAPVFLGLDGLPLNGGWVGFFDPSTDAPKDVYSDSTLSTPVANPQVLGADGRMPTGTGVWYGVGTYRVRLYNAQGAEIWMRDGIDGVAQVQPLSVTRDTVETMADLRLLAPGAYGAVELLGYYHTTDGGGGLFAWKAGITTPDNNGTIIQPSAGGAGRWVRMSSLEVDPRWFGAVEGETTTANTLLSYAWTWAKSIGQALHLVGGQYDLGGNITFGGEGTLIIDDGASFTNSTSASIITISCTNAVIRSQTTLLDSACTLEIGNGMEVRPEWWGVTGGAGEGVQWTAVHNGCADSPIRLSKTYIFDGGTLDPVSGFIVEPLASLSVSSALRVRSLTIEPRDPSAYIFLPLTANFDITLDYDEIPAWWFYLGTNPTVDATGYARLVMNATRGGTKLVRIVWEKFALFEFSAVPTHIDWVTSVIMPGTIVDATTGAGINFLGFVEAGNYQIFDVTGKPPILNQPGPLEWFGAVQYDASTGAINSAALLSASIRLTEIDGLGTAQKYITGSTGGYYIGGSFDISRLPARGLCLLSDGTALMRPAANCSINAIGCLFNGVFDSMASKGFDIQMKDCRATGNFTLYSLRVAMSGCEFSGRLNLFNTAGDCELLLRNNSFGSLIAATGAGYTGIVSNNIFTEDADIFALYGIVNMAVIGNTSLTNQAMLIVVADTCTISGNAFNVLTYAGLADCSTIGNASHSATTANTMGGTGGTCVGNSSVSGLTGTYTFVPITNVAYNT